MFIKTVSPTKTENSRLSIVIPAYNEAESLPILLAQLQDVVKTCGYRAEVIVINDGSTDGTVEVLDALLETQTSLFTLRVIHFRRNQGKAEALMTGFAATTGDIVITMDADLQDDPSEIPKLLETLNNENYDVVSGWKYPRKDPLEKRAFSFVFNRVTAFSTGVKLHDMNCGFKAYRAEVVKELHLYGDQHRYIPILAHQAGSKIGEVKVCHHPRRFGVSKYGLKRIPKGFFDLFTVLFLTKYLKRPLHVFGTVVLRCLSKIKGRNTRGKVRQVEGPTRVFVEIGTGQRAEWTYLIRDDWQDIARSKIRTDRLRALPESWLSKQGNWYGYLVEAHPRNFSALVEKTVADKKLRPFLHRLTFINAAISGTSQWTTMGMETGVFKGLFVNRYTLTSARSFHPSAVDNTVDFGLFTVSLETLLSAIGHEHIDLLRMDVEGAEIAILEAYSFHIKPHFLSIEYHSKAGKVLVRHILEKHGYQMDAQNTEELRGCLKRN